MKKINPRFNAKVLYEVNKALDQAKHEVIEHISNHFIEEQDLNFIEDIGKVAAKEIIGGLNGNSGV